MAEPTQPTTPRNTAATDPAEGLLIAASRGGIEAQEAQGQRDLLNSETLPSEILHCTQEDMEALGFDFGDEVPGDPLFRQVRLPAGWSRKGSPHAMWSDIVDERGIARVAVFYKAAFYDRRAHMSIASVGGTVANDWIYGDNETPTLHPELTEVELAGVRSSAEGYLASAEKHPDIYGDRLPRVQSLIAALDVRAAGANQESR